MLYISIQTSIISSMEKVLYIYIVTLYNTINIIQIEIYCKCALNIEKYEYT